MADDPLWIDDGFSRKHSIPAAPGLHPAVEVLFRPALDRERREYEAKLAGRSPEAIDKYRTDLIARYVLEVNGEPMHAVKDKLTRLHPAVRSALVDVVLSFDPAQELAALKN